MKITLSIILFIAGIGIFLWGKKSKPQPEASTVTPATPATQKFSWGSLIVPGIILGTIAGIILLLWSLFGNHNKVVAEMIFTPNVWSRESLGCQKFFDGEKGKYRISATGLWYKSTKTGNFLAIPPEGKDLSFPDNFTLPLPSAPFGVLIGRMGEKKDGAYFLIGKNATVVLDDKYPIFLTVNIPQEWNVSSNNKINGVFANNKGDLVVKAEKLL
ncbi:MAG: hypothetical protein UR69_C0004G0009 [Candidatus Moranbacteria bacterium GW2011_GWE2_35_2-]|nr:MAG: hypothetical protein UR69_C0004G0009 [Candidatus Moranbacteria bacterium GW2011_GWE2_35_2-]KKQ22183.1 MAG: hypothetical protein US37_C0003G0009 [Candidatus Moranbacteria bacterium GW2011_GWF2_37_11]KKQ28761.1 MAG: hypothetical protein US44_C0007G0047 [Candidatus Moranbacteria bacterium GW2011_GWD1_37_17]KKQ30325.1 MAG: hypothetical protein US47_C0003G0120 [Candidatus Moranbacteria bacterium GW2011_GWE1_37_24]KKQ46657.1 MAG: hypothetical protein US66_C0033G0002 [Candidatus Moranbacteria 